MHLCFISLKLENLTLSGLLKPVQKDYSKIGHPAKCQIPDDYFSQNNIFLFWGVSFDLLPDKTVVKYI